ncbi:hypothetical protein MM188_003194 [Vibrio cholerae]|nr:hypothetical protein [Vibrio cholerae]
MKPNCEKNYRFNFRVAGAVTIKGDGHAKGSTAQEAKINARNGVAKQLSVELEAVTITGVKPIK